MTTLDAQPSSQTVASLIVNVTGLLVVSTELKRAPGAFILATGTHHPVVCQGRRQSEPTAVFSGVPSYPRGWELLRVRISSLHPLLETDIGLLFLLNAASTTFSVSTMVLDRVCREDEG